MSKKINRREFIKLASAGTAVSGITVTTLRNRPSKAKERSPYRWAMVIDQATCVGCGECSLACQAHNDTREEAPWNRMIALAPMNGEPVYAPVPCMHCENAPCVDICPVGATYHRADGIVMMDYDKCIGCRYCQLACPYGARTFNWETYAGENSAVPEWGEPEVERRPRGVAEKCTFCFHRIDRGLAEGRMPGIDRQATPACVAACPTGARIFGDLNDPDSPVSLALARSHAVQLRHDLGTEPRVFYLPARRQETD